MSSKLFSILIVFTILIADINISSAQTVDSLKKITKSNDSSTCKTLAKVLYPVTGVGEDGVAYDIVGQQRVDVKECINVGRICHQTENKSSHCANIYSKIDLNSIGKDGVVAKRSFKYPSGCMCSNLVDQN